MFNEVIMHLMSALMYLNEVIMHLMSALMCLNEVIMHLMSALMCLNIYYMPLFGVLLIFIMSINRVNNQYSYIINQYCLFTKYNITI